MKKSRWAGAAALMILFALIFLRLPGTYAASATVVGISVPDIRDPFYLSLLYGVSIRAKKAGARLVLLEAGGFQNVERQVSQMEDLIQRRVNAILLNPADSKAVQGVITKAVQQGITVTGLGQPLGGAAKGFGGSPHCDIGKQMGGWLKQRTGGRGTIVALAGPAGAFWATERLRCFKETLAGTSLQIAAEQNSEPDRAKALSLAEDLLQRFPSADVVYTPTDFLGLGAADAVKAVGKARKVIVITAVLTPDSIDAIRNGLIQMSSDQRVVKMGEAAFDALQRAMRGEKDPVILVPPRTVTPENINRINLGESVAPQGWKPNF